MSSNKSVREQLERQYGKGCMFKKSGMEKKIEKKRVIKTYKKFLQEKRYTRKMIRKYERMMTLHHLKHRSEGGKTNTENGAVINGLAHIYMHSLPREQEEYINNELRRYKRQIDECNVVLVDDIDIPYTIVPMEFSIDDRKKGYDRNAKKREDKELIREYEEEER